MLELVSRFRLLAVLLIFLSAGAAGHAQDLPAMEKPFNKQEFFRTFHHGHADVNGVRLHYVMGGKGQPLLLVHGYPETWYGWHKIMPRLAQNYTVIAPDLRGLGDSSLAATGYAAKAAAEDLHRLMAQLGYTHFLLGGHDWGGAVSYALAAQYPASVTKFVFIESALPGPFLDQAMDVAHGGSWHFGFFMEPDFPEMLTAGKAKAFLTAFAFKGSFVYKKDAFSEADIDEYTRHYVPQERMKAGFAYYRAIPQDKIDNEEFTKTKLPMPVLALGGGHSLKDVPLKNMQAVAENVTGNVIQDSGHFIAEEQPQLLLDQLLAFFAAGS